MKRREPTMEPELEALLNPRRVERRAPSQVRARAIARVRAIVAAGGQIPSSTSLSLAPPPLPQSAPSHGLVRLVLPASFAAAAIVAVGAATAGRAPPARGPTLAASAPPTAISPTAEDLPTPQAASPPVLVPPTPAHSARPNGDVGTTELELLARAHAAYTQRDFARAISLVSELNRRFPNGHLAEEREALRIRSLTGAGRAAEAQRAAAAFAVRFPRSVLLSKGRKL